MAWPESPGPSQARLQKPDPSQALVKAFQGSRLGLGKLPLPARAFYRKLLERSTSLSLRFVIALSFYDYFLASRLHVSQDHSI